MANKKAPKTATSDRKTMGKSLEIATRQRSIDWAYFMGMLPNPDPVLKKLGRDITIYEDLKADAHLGSVISSRKSGVKRLLWELDRGKAKSRQAKAIEEHFATLPIASIISEIMDAPFFGYQPLEVVWELGAGGYILPVRVVGKPPEWFHFDEDNRLKFRSHASPTVGEDVPDRKFLLPRHNATYKNPYGEPLLSRCYWPVTFKRSGVRFWVTFAEKYGMPWAVGKLPRNSPDSEYEKLKDVLEAMVQDALAAIPDDASVELHDAGAKGASAEIYNGLVAWADSQMSKAIVGHSGAADSTPGKLGGEDNAMDVRQDLIDEDKGMVEAVFNQLIQWICEINFGDVPAPKFILYAEEEVDQAQATRDKSLTDQGVEFSQAYYEREYGFQEGDIVRVSKPGAAAPADPAAGGKPAEFAEGRKKTPFADQDAVDEGIAAVTRAEDLRRETAAIQQVLNVFAQANNYSEAMEKAIELFPTLDTDVLQEKLGKAIFLSGLVGRLSAQD